MAVPNDLEALAELLAGAGFVAAEEEADELLARAAGDVELLDSLVARRLTGEPLAWITGSVSFCGLEIRVDPGVYVPRWQSEPLARRAAERLPANGVGDRPVHRGRSDRQDPDGEPPRRARRGVRRRRARRRVRDGERRGGLRRRSVRPAAARARGTRRRRRRRRAVRADARRCRCCSATPSRSSRRCPTTAAATAPRSCGACWPTAPRFLRPGGALLLELGGEQADALGDDLARLGYADVIVLVDEDGDVRGIEATLADR